jgi:hypothetical protein
VQRTLEIFGGPPEIFDWLVISSCPGKTSWDGLEEGHEAQKTTGWVVAEAHEEQLTVNIVIQKLSTLQWDKIELKTAIGSPKPSFKAILESFKITRT